LNLVIRDKWSAYNFIIFNKIKNIFLAVKMVQILQTGLTETSALIKILVVDDDKLIRWSLKEILSQEGCEVDAVATATEALIQVENRDYNLCFADIDIKDENGIEMLKKIKIVRPEAKIIILSAHTRNKIESQLGSLCVLSIIEKPFQSEQIRNIVKNDLE
jgi:two-component system response regulator (stage 0 sporulation protein F)